MTYKERKNLQMEKRTQSSTMVEMDVIYLLVRHYSDEAVGTFDTTESAYRDETTAEIKAIEKNDDPGRHPYVDYFVEPMNVIS